MRMISCILSICLLGSSVTYAQSLPTATAVGQTLRATTLPNTYAAGPLDLADTDAITGDLPDANLSANVSLLNGTNIWTSTTRPTFRNGLEVNNGGTGDSDRMVFGPYSTYDNGTFSILPRLASGALSTTDGMSITLNPDGRINTWYLNTTGFSASAPDRASLSFAANDLTIFGTPGGNPAFIANDPSADGSAFVALGVHNTNVQGPGDQNADDPQGYFFCRSSGAAFPAWITGGTTGTSCTLTTGSSLNSTYGGNAPLEFGTNSTYRGQITAAGIWHIGPSGIRVDATSASGQTRLMLYDVDNGTMERVTVGPADSCGTGYKCLRIPN